MHRKRGFTLIELMVVVVIIGIIAAVAIPALLGLAERARKKEETRDRAVVARQTPPAAAEHRRPAPPPAANPKTESADIRIRLSASNYISKFKVYTRFEADFSGSFVFSNPDPSLKRVRLRFPFPRGTTQARDVSLAFVDGEGRRSEPVGVDYTLRGIQWIGPLPPGQRLTAAVTYRAQGNDRYVYDGPGAGRAGALRIDMTLAGVTSETIPPDALQPTTIEPGHLVWDFKNLITDRKLRVEMPGATSPVGRVILLLRLAALAVLLFGIGFMYLNDMVQPGRLDSFNWGHFLILACTYALFFVIFTALNLGGGVATIASLAWAAVLALPLLMIHVSRFWGTAFALTHILPLAVFTLCIVINGVYGGPWRMYGFIAFTVLAVAFFTFTYRGWWEKRRAYRVEKARRAEAQREEEARRAEEEKRRQKQDDRLAAEARRVVKEREARIRKVFDRVARAGKPDDEAARLADGMRVVLESEDASEHAKSRAAVVAALAKLDDSRTRLRDLKTGLKNLEKIPGAEDLDGECIRIEDAARSIEIGTQARLKALREAGRRLEQLREQAKRLASHRDDLTHCMACGRTAPPARFCPHCGVAGPRELVCPKCGHTDRLPVHLLDWTRVGRSLHCTSCGQAHADVSPRMKG